MPRLTTVLILMGDRPALTASRMPSSTRSLLPRLPLISANTASSRESRLTVTRSIPAAFSAAACAPSSMPFVVSARSSMPSIRLRSPIRSGRFWRNNGSPPVMRNLRTPSFWNTCATRTISSNDRRSLLRMNSNSLWNLSSGMQYGQRKLQRSMTEMRRSCSGRPSRSAGPMLPLSKKLMTDSFIAIRILYARIRRSASRGRAA